MAKSLNISGEDLDLKTLLDPNFSYLAENSWTISSSNDFLTKLKACIEDTINRGKQLCIKYFAQIDQCIKELEVLRNKCDDLLIALYHQMQEKLNQLIAQDEAYRKQLAKVYWLKERDMNLKYFHSCATSR